MLPDGIVHTKGFVKDPDEAQRYKSLIDVDQPQTLGMDMDLDQPLVTEKLEDRKKTDLNKNVALFFFFSC